MAEGEEPCVSLIPYPPEEQPLGPREAPASPSCHLSSRSGDTPPLSAVPPTPSTARGEQPAAPPRARLSRPGGGRASTVPAVVPRPGGEPPSRSPSPSARRRRGAERQPVARVPLKLAVCGVARSRPADTLEEDLDAPAGAAEQRSPAGGACERPKSAAAGFHVLPSRRWGGCGVSKHCYGRYGAVRGCGWATPAPPAPATARAATPAARQDTPRAAKGRAASPAAACRSPTRPPTPALSTHPCPSPIPPPPAQLGPPPGGGGAPHAACPGQLARWPQGPWSPPPAARPRAAGFPVCWKARPAPRRWRGRLQPSPPVRIVLGRVSPRRCHPVPRTPVRTTDAGRATLSAALRRLRVWELSKEPVELA
eukprot:TRINITY_DN11315_c0_g1_i1.p1 TRINITY_DN11315_c0_g1~~TRINITY_DN11315_c0_g1_i1.p1  ORF type:complete len:389 (+),score=10.81 TRINITY_DN11315_c0_g1_i1:69-1169(+)